VAQFGRSGIVNETTAILIGQFVRNVEATLAGGDTPEAAQLSAGSVAWQLVKSKVFKRGEE
jgi:hypothetical protein